MERQETAPVMPDIDIEQFTPGITNVYEVVDITGQIPGTKESILIYTTSSDRHGNDLSYDKKVIGSYSSYENGIRHSEKEAIRTERARKALLASTGGSAILTAITYRDIYEDIQSKNENNDHVMPSAVGAITTAVLIMGSWLAKDARTRARNKKAALEGARASGARRFLSRFDSKL